MLLIIPRIDSNPGSTTIYLLDSVPEIEVALSLVYKEIVFTGDFSILTYYSSDISNLIQQHVTSSNCQFCKEIVILPD